MQREHYKVVIAKSRAGEKTRRYAASRGSATAYAPFPIRLAGRQHACTSYDDDNKHRFV